MSSGLLCKNNVMGDNTQQPPRKSSNEILSELFGAFNAEPPPIITATDINVDNLLTCESNSVKSHKKHKKHHKKLKKRKKPAGGSPLNSDNGTANGSKKHKHKKKHKRHNDKHGISSGSDGKDNDQNLVAKKEKKKKHEKNKKLSGKKTNLSCGDKDNSSKPKTDLDKTIIKDANDIKVSLVVGSSKKLNNLKTSLETSATPSPSVITLSSESKVTQPLIEVDKIDLTADEPTELSNIKAPPSLAINDEIKVVVFNDNKQSVSNCKFIEVKNDCPIIIKGVADAFVEDCLESGVKPEKTVGLPEKRKFTFGSKIMIKNLKNSTVFEETVRQVEEQARLKAERYEEGEISDESSNNNESKSSSRSVSPAALSPSIHSLPKITVENKLKSSSRKKSSEKVHSGSGRSHGHKHHKSSIEGSSSSSHKRDSSTKRRSKSKEKHKSSKHKSKSKSPVGHATQHNKKRSRSKSKSKERDKNVSSRKKHRSGDRPSKHRHQHHHSSRRRSSASPSDRDYYRSHRSYRKRSKSKSRSRSRSRSRGRSRSPYSKDRRQDGQEKIDKQRLLEIARKNALNMLKQSNSVGGGSVNAPGGGVEQTKATIAAGGKTVDELTDFCKLLSKKDAEGHESISSNTSNNSSDSESEKPFHHPFQIKDRPQSIVLNIRNSVAVPVKTLQEKTAEQSKALRMQFPVSSGQLHRKKESDWVPVSPKSDQQGNNFGLVPHTNNSSSSNVATAIVPPLPAQISYPGQQGVVQPSLGSPLLPPQLPPPPLPPPGLTQPITYPVPLPPDQMYGGNNLQTGEGPLGFEDQQPSCSGSNVDITSAVAHRLSAMKRLQENPNDIEAIIQMNKAQQEAQAWVQSKYEPGQFTGSTGARVLSQAELASGTQAWARKDYNSSSVSVGLSLSLTNINNENGNNSTASCCLLLNCWYTYL